MARCGCVQSGCACVVAAGDGLTVDVAVAGNGAPGTPYQVSAEAVLVPDGEGPLAGANPLKADALGLYVDPAELECSCSAMGADLAAGTTIDLVADTSVDLTIPVVRDAAVSTADWTQDGDSILWSPATPRAFFAGLQILYEDLSGTDAVQVDARIDLTDGPNAPSQYMPDGFPISGFISIGALLQHWGTDTPSLSLVMRLTAPAAATRSMTIQAARIWAYAPCSDCPWTDFD